MVWMGYRGLSSTLPRVPMLSCSITSHYAAVIHSLGGPLHAKKVRLTSLVIVALNDVKLEK